MTLLCRRWHKQGLGPGSTILLSHQLCQNKQHHAFLFSSDASTALELLQCKSKNHYSHASGAQGALHLHGQVETLPQQTCHQLHCVPLEVRLLPPDMINSAKPQAWVTAAATIRPPNEVPNSSDAGKPSNPGRPKSRENYSCFCGMGCKSRKPLCTSQAGLISGVSGWVFRTLLQTRGEPLPGTGCCAAASLQS